MNQLANIHAPAIQSNVAATYRDLADEAGGTSDLLKFKRGKFLRGRDEDEVRHGTRFAVNMNGILRGYIRFGEDGVEKAMAHPGEPAITRESLGNTDEAYWDKDENGIVTDPWVPTWEVPLKNMDTGEELTFATSSAGGKNAVGRLCLAFGNRLAAGNPAIPIIELVASSYTHRRFGTVDVPLLKIVAWQTENELIAAETPGRPRRAEPAPVPGFDDKIPF